MKVGSSTEAWLIEGEGRIPENIVPLDHSRDSLSVVLNAAQGGSGWLFTNIGSR